MWEPYLARWGSANANARYCESIAHLAIQDANANSQCIENASELQCKREKAAAAAEARLAGPSHVQALTNSPPPLSDDTRVCAICLTEVLITTSSHTAHVVRDPEQEAQHLICGHVFHKGCLDDYQDTRRERLFPCPVCKVKPSPDTRAPPPAPPPPRARAPPPPPPLPQNFQALAEPHPPPPANQLCSDPEEWEVLLRAFAGPDLPDPPSCSRPSSSHEQPSIANQLPALTNDSLTCIGGSQTGIECPCHGRFGWHAKNCPSWKMQVHLNTWEFERRMRSIWQKVNEKRPELREKWNELYRLWEKSTSCPAVEPYVKHVSIAVHRVRSPSMYHFQLLCVSCGHCSALMYCE